MTALSTIGPPGGAATPGDVGEVGAVGAVGPVGDAGGGMTSPQPPGGAALDEVDGLRRAACSVRHGVIRQLPEVLERFADEVLTLGGHVCWAHTATDARHYIANVAVRHNARTVLRWTASPDRGAGGAPAVCGGAGSGAVPVCGALAGTRAAGAGAATADPRASGDGGTGHDGVAGTGALPDGIPGRAAAPATADVPPLAREIDVDRTIGYCQAEVVPTGLHEWVARLADDAPDELVAAAGGAGRRGIPDLLVEQARARTGLRRRPGELVRLARARLQRQFAGAEVGVGIAELAVAETGSLVLITDQATTRLATVLPDVQVVILGLDQVIAAWDQADLLLTLHHQVTRAAARRTGGRLGAGSPSTTVLTGPRRPSELDGPRELHVVVLDNGRSHRLGRVAQTCAHPDTAASGTTAATVATVAAGTIVTTDGERRGRR